jgi:hypothetical protein
MVIVAGPIESARRSRLVERPRIRAFDGRSVFMRQPSSSTGQSTHLSTHERADNQCDMA